VQQLLCEYLLQSGQDGRQSFCSDRAEPLDQAYLVDCSDLIEHDQAFFLACVTGTRKGAAKLLLVIGATITVRRC
jgi:hypothetical protein